MACFIHLTPRITSKPAAYPTFPWVGPVQVEWRKACSLTAMIKKGSRRLISIQSKLEGMTLGFEKSKAMELELTITQPDDWHLHLRDGHLLESVVAQSATTFRRAIIMPNLKPPITTAVAAIAYRERIMAALPSDSNFIPLMTLYLTDNMSRNEIKLARESGVIFAVKLYPAGATTNSQDGVTDIFGKCMHVLQEMMECGMPLLVHGEVSDPKIDIFDREKMFIDNILKPLVEKLPQLKIVMEHITTVDAVNFVQSCTEGTVAATVTPQHLLLNRNALFEGGIQPHNYCLPVLKREIHRQAILSAVTSGSKRFFLGTDSAPHERHQKERSCGCAGIYSAPIALPLYAKAFEQKLETKKFLLCKDWKTSLKIFMFCEKRLQEKRIWIFFPSADEHCI